VVLVSAAFVLVPGTPLIQILFLSQALNALLLVPLLVFICRIAGDRQVMGEHANGRTATIIVWGTVCMIAACIAALAYFTTF